MNWKSRREEGREIRGTPGGRGSRGDRGALQGFAAGELPPPPGSHSPCLCGLPAAPACSPAALPPWGAQAQASWEPPCSALMPAAGSLPGAQSLRPRDSIYPDGHLARFQQRHLTVVSGVRPILGVWILANLLLGCTTWSSTSSAPCSHHRHAWPSQLLDRTCGLSLPPHSFLTAGLVTFSTTHNPC